MSARPRATPWFGTLGERLETAEAEARKDDARRTSAALRRLWLGEGFPSYRADLGEISNFVRAWAAR